MRDVDLETKSQQNCDDYIKSYKGSKLSADLLKLPNGQPEIIKRRRKSWQDLRQIK